MSGLRSNPTPDAPSLWRLGSGDGAVGVGPQRLKMAIHLNTRVWRSDLGYDNPSAVVARISMATPAAT